MWLGVAMRSAVLGVVAACGRVAFDLEDGAPSDFEVAYLMDDPIEGGIVPATAAEAGHDGTCTVCPAMTAGRRGGGGYSFGNGQSVALPASVDLAGPMPFTIAVWIAPSKDAVMSLVAKPYGPGTDSNVVSLKTRAGTSSLMFETTPDGVAYDFLNTPEIGDVGDRWRHVALSWDGTTKRIYLDGALAGEQSATMVSSGAAFELGMDVDKGAGALYYQGALDELLFYRRALRDDEIAALAR